MALVKWEHPAGARPDEELMRWLSIPRFRSGVR